MPPLFAEYYRLFREVEIQQEIYKVLYPQFEQQKLNFNEINSGLSLIDEPTLPTYKFYPKRAFIVIAFFSFGLYRALASFMVRTLGRSYPRDTARVV